MRCPNCRKTVTWKDNPYRPFCSDRCKLLDLEGWLSERYRIPVQPESRAETSELPEETRKTKGARG